MDDSQRAMNFMRLEIDSNTSARTSFAVQTLEFHAPGIATMVVTLSDLDVADVSGMIAAAVALSKYLVQKCWR